MIKRILKQIMCMHIYNTHFVAKDGAVYLADECIYCGKIKIIC